VYAMESGTSCVICGNPFDIEGDVHNLDPKEPRYQVRSLHSPMIEANIDSSGFSNSAF
jgi:hypothetical protein